MVNATQFNATFLSVSENDYTNLRVFVYEFKSDFKMLLRSYAEGKRFITCVVDRIQTFVYKIEEEPATGKCEISPRANATVLLAVEGPDSQCEIRLGHKWKEYVLAYIDCIKILTARIAICKDLDKTNPDAVERYVKSAYLRFVQNTKVLAKPPFASNTKFPKEEYITSNFFRLV